MCAKVILVSSHVTYLCLIIGQNSLTGHCVSNAQTIYKFKMPIDQQPMHSGIRPY